jgi:TRAP-type mannitol/chloroaromatic compound transport system substrate-binding protein
MHRRRFLARTGSAVATAGATAIAGAPSVIAQPKFQWRMAASWTPATDVLWGGARRFAAVVDELTGGRLKIEPFASGELVGTFDVFDACQQGTVEAFHSFPGYWGGKDPALQWFGAVPFGLNAQGTATWLHAGDGLRLWEEAYAPFGLLPRPGGASGVQMGGWFRKRIDRLADIRGLKVRMHGLGGRVLARAGATAMLMPLSQVLPALEQGTIDGVELVAPHDDLTVGLYRGARYYYYPGWHELGVKFEFTFNRKAYEALPVDLRRALDYAALAVGTLMLAEYEGKNALALSRLRTELKDRVEVLAFPAPVLTELKRLSAEVLREESEKSPMARKVHRSYTSFQELLRDWSRISEGAYHALAAG